MKEQEIFDYELSPQDKRMLRCPSTCYTIALSLNLIMIALQIPKIFKDNFDITPYYGRREYSLNLPNCSTLTGFFINLTCNIFSMIYVYCPTTPCGRSVVAKFMIVIFMVYTGFYIVAAIVSIILFSWVKDASNNKDLDNVFDMYLLVIFIATLIPVFHCIMLGIIWRQRAKVAWKLEDKLDDRYVDLDDHLAQTRTRDEEEEMHVKV